jgi:hypothetical protein
MALVFFWLKIAVKRIVYVVKIAPVLVIGTAIIIFALIVAKKDLIITLDTQKLIMTASIFVFISLLLSLKKYNLVSRFILYSKSNFMNKVIRRYFFMGQAFAHNILLLFFNFYVLKGILKVEHFIYPLIITLFSIIVSFAVMIIKNKYTNKITRITKTNRIYIKPAVKSLIHDYFTPGFFQAAALAFFLCIIFVMELLKNINLLHEMENPHFFFMGLTAFLSIGFMGIVDSILHINWKFYAVIMPADFKYHVTRTILFLTAIFGVLIAVFVVSAASFSIIALIKYLYCVIVLLFISIHTGFIIGGMLIKAIWLMLATIVILRISILPAYFLVLPAFFALILLVKAKNSYKERYFL